jgi:hypothetical protein
VYRWIVRRSYAEGQFTWRTTYAEAAAGAGYEVPRLNCRENRKQARQMRVSTVYRALCSLRGAGIIEFGGFKRPNGQWRCLRIRLLPKGRGEVAAEPSPRRPVRCPGKRIFFDAPKWHVSPVGGKSRGFTAVTTRPRARVGRAPPVEQQHREEVRRAIRESLAGARRASPPNPADVRPGEELAALCAAFRAAFGCSPKFGVERDRHGGRLLRILARLDRFHDPKIEPWGEEGPGLELALRLIRDCGDAARHRLGGWGEVESLAYFLPILHEIARRRRRRWRAVRGQIKREHRAPWRAAKSGRKRATNRSRRPGRGP